MSGILKALRDNVMTIPGSTRNDGTFTRRPSTYTWPCVIN
jgi:hypothetical protein